MLTPTLVAILLASGMSATACGSDDKGVSKSALVAKVKEDPELKELPDAVIECMADVYIKYGDKKQLKDLIDGKISSGQNIKGLDFGNKKAMAEIEACAAKK